ncbi:MAG: biopolymer transporter ExbD [Deltaproteobacteria bacterium]|nr:biopolymer transporter ExbD [Deltaproteobacteria bacterium]|tara:strand:+ start:461 stop:898 length:438 start_codon:yes stop_codon:yes gene_type:complete
MAGAAGDDEEDGMTGINVVPLVDIMLVLLIIFMVSTEFVQQELKNKIPPNIPVELPRAASAEETEPSLLSLVINKDGDLFLNGKEATQAEVKTYVDEMKGKGTKMQAVIAADERVSHGSVIELIDVIRIWGIDDFAINTKRQEIE